MQLIVTVAGDHQGNLFERVIAAIRECECHVKECRMVRMMGGNAGFVQVEGNWNHIARLENLLTALAQTGQVHFHRLAEDTKSVQDDILLYVADVVSRERTEILEEMIGFFSAQGVELQDLRSSCYRIPYSGANICTMHMLLRIPEGVSVISLRDEFLDLCEQMQVDAIFEPIKPII